MSKSKPTQSSSIKALVDLVLKEEVAKLNEELLLQEGFFQNLKSGLGFAAKLVYLQSTKGPEAVSDELVTKLETFIQKAKGSKKLNFAMNSIVGDLEEKLQTIKTTKQRYRDSKGRYSKDPEEQDFRDWQASKQKPVGFGKVPSASTSPKKSLSEAKVGREYNHIEDLVFLEGSAGALRAADALEASGQDARAMSIKWDGSPTIYWGNDPETGEFVMVGKNGWGRNKSTSAEDLHSFITSSGKGEPWREQFGSDMSAVFNILKQSTPSSFSGFVFGDLLYYPGKPFQRFKDHIEFTPNLVTYKVPTTTKLGYKMMTSQLGVVVHTKYDTFGDKSGIPVANTSELNSKLAVVLGQTYVSHQPEVDVDQVSSIRSLANSQGTNIDSFLEPKVGLSDLSAILYSYVNKTSKSGQLGSLGVASFAQWLESSASKVSIGKQTKIKELLQTNSQGLEAIFKLVIMIMEIKNNIIDQLDSAQADVTATTGKNAGGEGYVDTTNHLKFVPRHRWTPS